MTVVAVAVAALASWLASEYATGGGVELLADTIAAGVFVLVWAGVVWWMPELVRETPPVEDRVQRASLT